MRWKNWHTFHANVCQIFIFDYLFRSCTYSRLKFQKTGQKVGPAHIFSYQEPTISSANNRKDFSEKRPQKRLENAFDILFSRWCMSVFLKRKKLQKPRAFGAFSMAPPVGLEPTTLRLTAACSTDWAIEEYKRAYFHMLLCRHWPIFPDRDDQVS